MINPTLQYCALNVTCMFTLFFRSSRISCAVFFIHVLFLVLSYGNIGQPSNIMSENSGFVPSRFVLLLILINDSSE